MLVALAIWAFDGWLIYGPIREMPRSNADLSRQEICWWAEERFINSHPIDPRPGDNPYPACIARSDVYQQVYHGRQSQIEESQRLLAVVAASIATIPIAIAGLFLVLRRACVFFVAGLKEPLLVDELPRPNSGARATCLATARNDRCRRFRAGHCVRARAAG